MHIICVCVCVIIINFTFTDGIEGKGNNIDTTKSKFIYIMLYIRDTIDSCSVQCITSINHK